MISLNYCGLKVYFKVRQTKHTHTHTTERVGFTIAGQACMVKAFLSRSFIFMKCREFTFSQIKKKICDHYLRLTTSNL